MYNIQSTYGKNSYKEPQRLCDILQMMFGEEMTNEWTKGNPLPDVACVDPSANGKSVNGKRKVTEGQTSGIKEEILTVMTEKRTPDKET
ncbi:MAG: hypothetical protein PHI48_09200 [Bacteroidales bacterium]|nr:hypothetical protein [Bacteroidales bacterium]MDD4822717.1 hypothetical protein [Bacteroidales bacterium]